MTMLGVCSASCRGDGARWGSGSQAERLRDAEAMPHPRENGCFPGLWQEGWTTLGLNSALPGRLWLKIKIRCDGAAAQSTALRARRCARAKTSGLPLPLTREPPRRRRIRRHGSTAQPPHFDMSATLADFCLRPDETNFSSPALSPAKAYSRSKREAAPSKQRRAAPVYADVVDVLATDAAGRKYGRRRCDDGAMYLGDFADDCLTREGWGMLVSLNGDT